LYLGIKVHNNLPSCIKNKIDNPDKVQNQFKKFFTLTLLLPFRRILSVQIYLKSLRFTQAAIGVYQLIKVFKLHDSELSKVKPRNFMLSAVVNFLSLCIMSMLLKKLFFVVNCIKWVFSQFKDMKFASNHSCICRRILLVEVDLKLIYTNFKSILFTCYDIFLQDSSQYTASLMYTRNELLKNNPNS